MLHCCRKHRWVKCKIYIRNTFSNLKKQTFLFNVPPSFSANFQNKRTICSFLEDWSKIRRIHSKLKNQTFLLNPKSDWGWVDYDYTFCRQGYGDLTISWLFLLPYMYNQKKIVFHIDIGYSRRCGNNQPLPRSSNIQ